MRTSIFVVVGLFVVATAASAAMFSDGPIALTSNGGSDETRADYVLYYHEGMSGWASVWTFSQNGHVATYFDPLDNLGDDIHEAYEIVGVESGWHNDSGGDIDVNLYVCADDDGEPDFGSPLFTLPVTINDTDPYWSQFDSDVDPPVGFNCGEMFWVVYEVFAENPHPASDMDDTDPQYHSYIGDEDGLTWDLFGADWKHNAYADPGESTNNVTPASFGHIKASYE
ncbi:MAG: hypothetical protein JSW52_07465 [Candidatus Coatesbacteria bacterium]|nr:MAG: hypothetical protein JSW52_07465 [Candidatus Coatesbacteria bacterium]